jgi:hypothetical protein
MVQYCLKVLIIKNKYLMNNFENILKLKDHFIIVFYK